jgi:predicted Zn-dependent protease
MSCASTNLPPIHAEKEAFTTEKDEEQIWTNAESIEQKIAKSGILYEDPQLDDYLARVAKNLFPPDLKTTGRLPRVKVIKNPLLNAFAMPNGAIYIHSGILSRMEEEVQLATVLGHEITHFTHRHSIKTVRSAQNKENVLRVFQILLAGGGQAGTAMWDLIGQIGSEWALASIRGYSRELETEADTEGLKLLVQAGYDPTDAVRVFELLQQDLDERKVKEPFFFGTHPLLQERIDNYRKQISSQYVNRQTQTDRTANDEEFLNRINPLLLENATLDIDIGRLNTAKTAIEKYIRWRPQNPRAHYLLGEVYRRSGQDEINIQKAMAAYREAVKLDPAYADPHRELGLLYRAQKRIEQARKELTLYVTLNPKAADVPIINGYLQEFGNP